MITTTTTRIFAAQMKFAPAVCILTDGDKELALSKSADVAWDITFSSLDELERIYRDFYS